MEWRKAQGLTRLVRKFGRREDGAAAVEFALVAAPFFILLLVIFETATVLFTDISLQNGVTAASRLIRTGQLQNSGLGKEDFRKAICDNVMLYVDCSKIRLAVRRATAAPPTPVNMSTIDEPAKEKWEESKASEWVLVQVTYDWQLFIPALSQLSNSTNGKVRHMTAGAVFRNEPYGG